MNLKSIGNTQATVSERNPKGLPYPKQLLVTIDFDKSDGSGNIFDNEILKITIDNAFDCDMSEYPLARKYLDTLKLYYALTPEANRQALKLVAELGHIEYHRTMNGGISFNKSR